MKRALGEPPSVAVRWLLAITCSMAGILTWTPPITAQPQPGVFRFEDVSKPMGLTFVSRSGSRGKDYIVDSLGNGAAFFDYDNDGRLDILLANGSSLEQMKEGGDQMVALYRNRGDRFVDVTETVGLKARGWGVGVCVADYDQDGDRDIYVTGYGRNVLFRNQPGQGFTEVAEESGAAGSGWGVGCAFGDYDRDGDLDLFVANYVAFDAEKTAAAGKSDTCVFEGLPVFCGPAGLIGQPDSLFRNNGQGRFEDVSGLAGVGGTSYFGLGAVFSDLDGDGWLDIYVANDSTPNLFLANNQDGTFSEMALTSGVALSEDARAQAGMGIATGDFNNDQLIDLFITNFANDSNTLYLNAGERVFFDSTTPARLGAVSRPYLSWGAGFVDFDLDGYVDLFIANGHVYPQVKLKPDGEGYAQPNQVLKNRGNEQFIDVSPQAGSGLSVSRSSRGAAFGDFDNDGDLDVLITNIDDTPTLLRNESKTDNHWLVLRLVAKDSIDAIGARVTLETPAGTQIRDVSSGGSYISQNDFRLHFGLGSAQRVPGITIRWPDGNEQKFADLPVDGFLLLKQGAQKWVPDPLR